MKALRVATYIQREKSKSKLHQMVSITTFLAQNNLPYEIYQSGVLLETWKGLMANLRWLEKNHHATPIDQLCERFKVDPDKGLHYSEVNRRAQEHGLNKVSYPIDFCYFYAIIIFMSMLTMCIGLVIPLIFCVTIAALSQNIWIIILTIILAIIIITSLIWSSYGEEKLMKPYSNREDVRTTQVLRHHNDELQELIVGYYRESLKQSPVSDIITLIQEYYRMHIPIFFPTTLHQ